MITHILHLIMQVIISFEDIVIIVEIWLFCEYKFNILIYSDFYFENLALVIMSRFWSNRGDICCAGCDSCYQTI